MKITTIDETRLKLLERFPKRARIAEIGVFIGQFSQEIIRICDPEKFYMVDLFIGNIVSGDQNGENHLRVDMVKAEAILRDDYKDNPRVEIVKSDGAAWLASVPEDHLNGVYIDSSHTFRTTLLELCAARRAVRHGGLICGHDYGSGIFPALKTAVDAFCEQVGADLEVYTRDKLWSFLIVNTKSA